MTQWLLQGIPAYTDGELLPTLYNLGSGLADDSAGASDEDSYMHIVRSTSEDAFLRWCSEVETGGFAQLFCRKTDSGLYVEYSKQDILLYAYYTPCDNSARILRDGASVSVPAFNSPCGCEKHADTQLMQFGLLYDNMIRWTSCDCGMNYVLRLRDGRLIVIDGGEMEQATETAVGEFMKRVRGLTGTNEGDPLTIAMWFCTHPHDDHMDFFLKLLRKFGDLLHVERLFFNFAAHSVLDLPDYIAPMRALLREKCPDALFLKPHTGQQFHIGNVCVDVLFTHEDLLAWEEETPDYYGINSTSTIVKFSFEDHSFLVLADANDEAGDVLCQRYPDGISCTFVQAAHHLINRVEHIYKLVRSEYVLIPEGRYLVHKNLRRNWAVICKYNDPDKIFLAGDYSAVFRVGGSDIEIDYYPLRGCLYDGT